MRAEADIDHSDDGIITLITHATRQAEVELVGRDRTRITQEGTQ